MATIGILGGGQLARMLALAGAPLGHRFLVVDSAEDACAGQVASLLRADWRDFEALLKFAGQVDVATVPPLCPLEVSAYDFSRAQTSIGAPPPARANGWRRVV